MNRNFYVAMSRESSSNIPPDVKARLEEEDETERADLETTWHLLDRVDSDRASLDLDEEWQRLQRRRPAVRHGSQDGRPASRRGGEPPSRESPRSANRRPARSTRSGHWGRWSTAVVVGVVLIAVTTWIWRVPVTVTAPPGQQRSITLPDGSVVELNSGTTLSYPRRFEKWPFFTVERRVVHLEGEAFFTAAEDPRPFDVNTSNARVTVEGTRFNVQARSRVDTVTFVTVTEGRVHVSGREGGQHSVVLDNPGQTTRLTGRRASPTPPESTAVDRVTAWRHEGFSVTDTGLKWVLRELERRYDTSIGLHESVQRTNVPLSLYYPTQTSLDVILRDVCTALDLHYRPVNRGYEIFAGPTGS